MSKLVNREAAERWAQSTVGQTDGEQRLAESLVAVYERVAALEAENARLREFVESVPGYSDDPPTSERRRCASCGLSYWVRGPWMRDFGDKPEPHTPGCLYVRAQAALGKAETEVGE